MSQEHFQALATGHGRCLRQYELTRLLGSDEYGHTYLAYDSALHCSVVIRELLLSDLAKRAADGSTIVAKCVNVEGSFARARTWFLNEGRSLMRMRHGCLPHFRDWFEMNGTAYWVTQHIEGESLESRLARHGAPGERELCLLLCNLLDGLRQAHQGGLLHREINPANILIDQRNRVPVLIDFAGHKAQIELAQRDTLLSISPTPYHAVENYSNSPKLGPWTDLYSLGAVIFRAMTGEGPPPVMTRVRDKILCPAGLYSTREYSQAFLGMVEKALELRPQDRWQSATEWLAALNRHCAEPVRGSPLRRAMAAMAGLVRPRRKLLLAC